MTDSQMLSKFNLKFSFWKKLSVWFKSIKSIYVNTYQYFKLLTFQVRLSWCISTLRFDILCNPNFKLFAHETWKKVWWFMFRKMFQWTANFIVAILSPDLFSNVHLPLNYCKHSQCIYPPFSDFFQTYISIESFVRPPKQP